ncbi:unnamed protein product [Prorocentrum cordatum]|uniref:Uncharacterized protein n=1 Tax=Prorocentrum cordatum TaxID=2364126 RepID=A0ABN9WFT1_9DINO|nr:unnamed protein product [Polarella glacialis]
MPTREEKNSIGGLLGMQLAMLAFLNSPIIILSIVFLILANRRIKFDCNLRCVEYFAGVGAVCGVFENSGYDVYKYEILREPKHNDILSDVGFAEAVRVALNMAPGGCCVMGPVCSSWVHWCMGTSGRRKWRPLGDQSKPWVQKANTMVSRVMLLVRILQSRGVFWVLEQPASSLMVHHPRFQELINDMDVHSVRMYMGNFGAETEKATILYSGSPEVKKIGGQKRRPHLHCPNKLVDESVDATGATKATGNSRLKMSQAYPRAFGFAIRKIWDEHKRIFIKRHRKLQDQTLDAGLEVNAFDQPSNRKEHWADAKLDNVIKYLQQ